MGLTDSWNVVRSIPGPKISIGLPDLCFESACVYMSKDMDTPRRLGH